VCVQGCQASAGGDSEYSEFLQSLPSHWPSADLMSQASVSSTIVRLYCARVSDALQPDGLSRILHKDSVFAAILSFYARQHEVGGHTVSVSELQRADGPVARLVLSCKYDATSLLDLITQHVGMPQMIMTAAFEGANPFQIMSRRFEDHTVFPITGRRYHRQPAYTCLAFLASSAVLHSDTHGS
jgi:hypothetical protein